MQTICDICRKNNAVIHIEKHAGEDHTQMKICCKCAGIDTFSPEKLKSEDIQKIISDLTSLYQIGAEEICEICGTSGAEFGKSHKVGCGACYVNLKHAINLQSWQDAPNLKHVGRTPRIHIEPISFDTSVEDVQILEEKLAQFIIDENYEAASEYRDRIEELNKART